MPISHHRCHRSSCLSSLNLSMSHLYIAVRNHRRVFFCVSKGNFQGEIMGYFYWVIVTLDFPKPLVKPQVYPRGILKQDASTVALESLESCVSWTSLIWCSRILSGYPTDERSGLCKVAPCSLCLRGQPTATWCTFHQRHNWLILIDAFDTFPHFSSSPGIMIPIDSMGRTWKNIQCFQYLSGGLKPSSTAVDSQSGSQKLPP